MHLWIRNRFACRQSSPSAPSARQVDCGKTRDPATADFIISILATVDRYDRAERADVVERLAHEIAQLLIKRRIVFFELRAPVRASFLSPSKCALPAEQDAMRSHGQASPARFHCAIAKEAASPGTSTFQFFTRNPHGGGPSCLPGSSQAPSPPARPAIPAGPGRLYPPDRPQQTAFLLFRIHFCESWGANGSQTPFFPPTGGCHARRVFSDLGFYRSKLLPWRADSAFRGLATPTFAFFAPKYQFCCLLGSEGEGFAFRRRLEGKTAIRAPPHRQPLARIPYPCPSNRTARAAAYLRRRFSSTASGGKQPA